MGNNCNLYYCSAVLERPGLVVPKRFKSVQRGHGRICSLRLHDFRVYLSAQLHVRQPLEGHGCDTVILPRIRSDFIGRKCVLTSPYSLGTRDSRAIRYFRQALHHFDPCLEPDESSFLDQQHAG